MRILNVFIRPAIWLAQVIVLGTWVSTVCMAQPADVQTGAAAKPAADDNAAGMHPGQRSGLPYELGIQATFIDQQVFKFHSPYFGPNSLLSRNENEMTDTYTVFAGVRPARGLELFVNPEMARGKGLSTSLGLAGFTNGDIVRNPELGMGPYLARYFVRYTLALGAGEEKIAPGENQIEGMRPTHRLVLTAGKVALTDFFDQNSYANNTRTQFMNWALINGAAYDYAADTRGYTMGAVAEYIQPGWALRLARFQMPTTANGPEMHQNLSKFHGDNIELETHPRLLRHKEHAVVRLLGYVNVAHMGNYRQALALTGNTGSAPDITLTERNSAVKYGFGLNFEQPLGDDGNTGLFGRYYRDDGATESYAYTECDSSLSLGFQLSGARWHRKDDRWAIALVQNDLCAAHKEYLQAGGVGFILGDGALKYGSEQIVETYYNYQLMRHLFVGPDYQFINNPGYNAARGPVSVISMRAHMEF